MKRVSDRELRQRRGEVVAAARALTDLELVNGGGTGSLHVTHLDPALTELAAGSGLFAPTLFDGYDDLSLSPAAYFATHGITTIEEVMTDNHWSYARSVDLAEVIANLGARHLFIKAHCPWQNGKVERFNRTLQIEWAYRQVFLSNDERAAALAPWLELYNTRRRHTALGGLPPISRLSPT